MKFIDLVTENKIFRDRLHKKFDKLFNEGAYILGPQVKELEDQLSLYTKSKYVLAVSSGTDALMLSLMALNIQPNDEIIVPAFNYISAAEVIVLLGAKPVFIDIDNETFNLDPNKIVDKITSKTKAIIPTSLFGQCADFKEINKIAKNHGLVVIEDASQSFGAEYYGNKSCNLTDIACTSFFPTKPLGCYGDGGAIFTKSKKIYEKLKMLRSHGQSKKYTHNLIGINGRLDTIQAIVLIEKLKIFEKEIKLRDKISKNYMIGIESEDQKKIRLPIIKEYNKSVFAQFSLMTNYRNELKSILSSKNIPVAIHYPTPTYKQKAFSKFRVYDCKVAEEVSKKIISIPFHPFMNIKDQNLVIKFINQFYRSS